MRGSGPRISIIDELAEILSLLHRRGVRGYVTLNTLVFTDELAEVETTVRELVLAGVDAVIIQDLGLARLIRAISPDLEIHASTQMSVTSAEGLALAKELGCSRVILARELSLDEIRKIRSQTDMPVEVFVHGALCVAYSGQCLTSEALGGRSANRGECAQACRMPYEIVCDGQLVDLDRTQYLLSPQDLAAYDLIPRLIELGVASLKIEGRLKSAEYVANITRHYRQAIDAAWAGRPVAFTPSRRRGDAALVLARLQPRLPRRQQPQGAGSGRLRQEARALPGRSGRGDGLGRSALVLDRREARRRRGLRRRRPARRSRARRTGLRGPGPLRRTRSRSAWAARRST